MLPASQLIAGSTFSCRSIERRRGCLRRALPTMSSISARKLRAVQTFFQQFLDLMDRPCRAAALQPVGICRGAFEVFIGRVTPCSQATQWFGHRDHTAGCDPAVIFHGTNKL